MLLGSGSIRKPILGPIVILQDLMEIFPYDDAIYMINVKGKQLKKMIKHVLRDEAFEGDHTEFYQYSSGVYIEYSKGKHDFIKFTFNGEDIDDDRMYKIGLQNYHYLNISDGFGVSLEEVLKNGDSKVVATSCRGVIEEYLGSHQRLDSLGSGRLLIKE